MKIISVVGARPNFVKIAPFIHAIEAYQESEKKVIQHILVHTGQHYDNFMSDTFFQSLRIPEPDLNLEIGSGSHAEQVGQTMMAFEKVVRQEKPDWVVVVGDVNATLACSVTAKKEGVKVCHIEAGLRSRDMSMPEEINRLVTDRLSDLLLTPDQLSTQNLLDEGRMSSEVKMVGNIMIDTLMKALPTAQNLSLTDIIKNNQLHDHKQVPAASEFVLLTMHRPSNVDDVDILGALIAILVDEITPKTSIVWPIHPRTHKNLRDFGLLEQVEHSEYITLLNPVGYFEMLQLNACARLVMTDSGGLQEETTVLGTPCMTLRFNTERPITLQENGGTSLLTGNDPDKIRAAFESMLQAKRKPRIPDLWDGHTAERCLEELLRKK